MKLPRSSPRTCLPVPALAVLLWLAAFSPDSLHAQDQGGLSLDSLLSVPVSAASKQLQTVRDAPASVTIITAEEIETYGWTDLGQVLNSIGGFYTSYDRNYTYLGVRGFGRPTDYNNRLLLLVDGHTLNEGFWGSAPAGPDLVIDLRSLARIEVIRGPGSVMYGTSAVFAVVNLVTRDGASLDGVQAIGATGSFGNHGGSVMTGTEFGPGIDVFASGIYGETDGQTLYFPELASDSATGGRIRNLDWEKRQGAALRLRHERSGLWVSTRLIRREKGIPTASYEQIPGNPNASTLDRYLFAEAGITRSLSPRLGVSARVYADDYSYEGDYAYDPLYTEKADNRIAGAEAILRWDMGPRNRTTFGTEYRDNYHARYRTPRDGVPDLAYGAPYHTWSAFVQHEVDVAQWLTIVAGFRSDQHSQFGNHVTPRGAAVIHPDRVTSIKVLYGEAFRAPTISEFENGGVEATGPELEPEEIRTLEVVLQRQASRGLLLTAGAFQYRMLNLIDQVPNPDDSVFVFRNTDKAEALGVYAGVEWQGSSGTRLTATASVVDADDSRTGKHLTNSPQLLVRAAAGFPLPKAFGLGVQARYESSRFTLAGSKTDAAFLGDAFLSWRPRIRPGIEAGLRVNNILDTDWSTPSGVQHLMPAIRQDGRNILLTVGIRF